MIQYKHSKTAGKLTKKQKNFLGGKKNNRKVKTFPSKLTKNKGVLTIYDFLEIVLPQLQFVLIIKKKNMLFACVLASCRCCLCQQSGALAHWWELP